MFDRMVANTNGMTEGELHRAFDGAGLTSALYTLRLGIFTSRKSRHLGRISWTNLESSPDWQGHSWCDGEYQHWE